MSDLMTDDRALQQDETFADEDDRASSKRILTALRKAEDAFRDWQTSCDVIDQIYSRDGYGPAGRMMIEDGFQWQDATLDLFWSSFEVLKPAVYARPPQPVVAPLFKDGKPLFNIAAELLERCAVSTFKRTNIGEVMIELRDDLIFAGRAVPWLRHEVEKGRNKVCVENKDRRDFLHEPVRKWSENGWVAAASWMMRAEMRKRFYRHSGNAYQDAKFTLARDREDGASDLERRANTRKAKVWEVWHKADNRVYWVTEGVDVVLDQGEPHLDLTDFFPCPAPAYATKQRRSLIPVPDYERYAVHFQKISELTRRIYSLLDAVKMKGLVAGGGDVGEAIEQIIRDESDEIIVPVPGAALLAHGSAPLVAWMPLAELATAIQGLIEARAQLISDFYELSGISDIMRGATEAEETLGAQELKSQYGSVRVREKSAELQRVAADAVKIASEIIAEKFTQDELLEMSQMDIPTRGAIEKRVKDIEKAARQELEALAEKSAEAARKAQEKPDPAQAKQAFEQAQQQILARYAPMLAEVEQQVPIEDVMKLLRDDRARNFVFEIESSSTILTDELAEKRSRNEFLSEFAGASQALSSMAAMGEPGAKLAGAMLKFVIAPYRAGRELDGAIEEFIDAAPEMARMAAQSQGESEELIAAQNKLAEAEQMKAQAAMAGVQARAQLDQAEMQRKMAEMQQKAQADQFKAAAEAEKLRQSLEAETAKRELIEAQINKLTADTAKILASIGLDERKQELEEYRAASDQRARAADQAMAARGQERDAEFRERGEERADRQQEFTERTAMNGGGA